MTYRLSELSRLLGVPRDGDGDPEIRGVAGISEAQSGDITFAESGRRIADLERALAFYRDLLGFEKVILPLDSIRVIESNLGG